MRVVILGGGAIGTTLARWLAVRGAEPVVVERHRVAGAASGKSGGFLARDWCDGTALEGLAQRSFALHAELAGELGGRHGDGAGWGYRRMETWGATFDSRGGGRAGDRGEGGARRTTEGPGWLAPSVRIGGRLGTAADTAQVHPARFTEAMAAEAERHGGRLVRARATGILRRGDRAAGVATAEEGEIEADAVVVAMGPWSGAATRGLGLPPVFALKGHSMVFRTGAMPAEAVFADGVDADGERLAPELFPRADGTAYVCAISSEAPLPADPAAVEPDAGAIERLRRCCAALSPLLAGAEVLAAQACHRPVTRGGLPMLGAVPGLDGAFVACGHGVWGILNAPGTAEAMAELVLDGEARTVGLGAFGVRGG